MLRRWGSEAQQGYWGVSDWEEDVLTSYLAHSSSVYTANWAAAEEPGLIYVGLQLIAALCSCLQKILSFPLADTDVMRLWGGDGVNRCRPPSSASRCCAVWQAVNVGEHQRVELGPGGAV